MTDIGQMLTQLKRAAEVETYVGPVPEGQIERLARETGCVLPDDFLHFLRAVGFASWVGHSVYGVFDPTDERFPPSFNFSAAVQTRRLRAQHPSDAYPFRDSSVVIEQDGMGGYFLLVSADVPSPQRVLWVSRDEGWVKSKGWDSFAAYLAYQVVPVATGT